MRRMYVRSVAFASAALLATLLMGTAIAAAGPKAPPNYGDPAGQQNPQELDECWHPDPVKCFTTGWASGHEVHIVADPFTGQGSGTVTFWCQSIVGFKYQVTVAGLEPQATYTVKTVGSVATTLGTFRSDPSGYGTLNGLLKLTPGSYYLVLQVWDSNGALVMDTHADGQGFGVFAH